MGSLLRLAHTHAGPRTRMHRRRMHRYMHACRYDAVMLYAHAANKTLSQGDDLSNGKTVTEAVRNTKIGVRP